MPSGNGMAGNVPPKKADIVCTHDDIRWVFSGVTAGFKGWYCPRCNEFSPATGRECGFTMGNYPAS